MCFCWHCVLSHGAELLWTPCCGLRSKEEEFGAQDLLLFLQVYSPMELHAGSDVAEEHRRLLHSIALKVLEAHPGVRDQATLPAALDNLFQVAILAVSAKRAAEAMAELEASKRCSP